MNEVAAVPNYWLIGIGALLAFLAVVLYGWISLGLVKHPADRMRKGLIGGITLGIGFAACGITFILAWSAFALWPVMLLFGFVMGILGVVGVWSPWVLIKILAHKDDPRGINHFTNADVQSGGSNEPKEIQDKK